MAGSVPIITAGQFAVTGGVEDHPVYFVRMQDGRELVVKGEARSATGDAAENANIELSIKWSSKLMKNVNHTDVNTKIMQAPEIQAFLAAARTRFASEQASRKYQNVTPGRANSYTWVKMPKVAGLTDAEFTKKVDGFSQPVKSKVKEQIARFRDEGLWPQLGKVVAVDIFNGNNDRFDTETGRWQNYGNVMFTNNAQTVIGLDTFDPFSSTAKIGQRPDDLSALDTLKDHAKMREFALKCTKSVGQTLARDAFGTGTNYLSVMMDTPQGRLPLQLEKKHVEEFYLEFAPAMVAGMQRGVEQLQQYLQRKVTQYKAQVAAAPVPQMPAVGGAPAPAPMRGRARAVGRADIVPQMQALTGLPVGILAKMNYMGWLR